MALPGAAVEPHVLAGGELAATSAGQQLQAEDLINTARRAARVLYVVGILQLAIGGVTLAFGHQLGTAAHQRAAAPNAVAMVLLILGALFVSLGIWSGRQPLPASLVGLCIYGTLVLLEIFNWIASIVNGLNSLDANKVGSSFTGMMCGGIIELIILAYLGRAVRAGLAHRRLVQMQSEPPA